MALEVNIKKQLGKFRLETEFSAPAGEVMGLLGASGCGKSMTLKCIAGIERPDTGRIVLDDQVLFDSDKGINLPPQKRQVGYLFQNYALFPNMTVAKNIAAGVRTKDKAQRSKLVEQMIHTLYLDGMEKKLPRQLSGGQQQRAALARILASAPKALLLDEPFSALDSYLKWQVELELKELLGRFEGPVLFVTHSRDEVYRLCRTVCVLDNGRSEPRQEVHALFDAPTTLSACLLSGCKNFSRARALPDGRVEALDWGVTLSAARPADERITYVGIRSHFLHPVGQAGENTIPCTVSQAIDDVFSAVVLCATAGGSEGYARLRLELPKEEWAALDNPDALLVHAAPEDVMLLSGGQDLPTA